MSETNQMTIVEFLEARTAEDEALASAALVGLHGGNEDARDYAGDVLGADRYSTPKQDEFITVWWPKRVLAECAAKRAIIKEREDPASLQDYDREGAFYASAITHVLECLAAVYKDHPDYQEEWRV